MSNPRLTAVIPFTCATNEYAEKPTAAVLELTQPLAERVQHLMEVCKREKLARVVDSIAFNVLDFIPSDTDEEQGLQDNIDNGEHRLLQVESALSNKLWEQEEVTGIRGHAIAVTSTCWYLTCYCKYSDVSFESESLPVPRLPLESNGDCLKYEDTSETVLRQITRSDPGVIVEGGRVIKSLQANPNEG